MQTIDFYKLSRALQDRFVESARGRAVPSPILSQPAELKAHRRWFVLSGLFLAAFGAAVCLGFGRLQSPHALAATPHLIVYALLVAGGGLSSIRALVLWRKPRMLPYRPATYLFPAALVDARARPFAVYSAKELKAFEVRGSTVSLSFEDGGPFELRAKDPEHAEQALTMFRECQSRLSGLGQPSRRELALLDPFCDTGFTNPLAAQEPRKSPRQGWAYAAIAVAVPVAAATAYGALLIRNELSERNLYQVARGLDTPQAYRAYVARGGNRLAVTEELLPRAQLKRVRAAGSVAELEEFAKTHQGSKIESEIREALRSALLEELKQAQNDSTLSALRGFEARFPQHSLVEKELRAAKNAVFAEALSQFKKQSLDDPRLHAFVKALLDYTREHGPKVEVRFRREVKTSLKRSDRQAVRDRFSLGEVSMPSQYFDADHARPREERIGKRLVDLWDSRLPEDIVDFEIGPPVEATGGRPKLKVPTLLIDYSNSGAGLYRFKKPRGVFIGVGMVVTSRFIVPEHPDVLEVRSSLWRVPDVKILEEEGKSVADVYAAMVEEGFDRFFRRHKATYFQDLKNVSN